jgi:Skp family chaperone for outer membrane proteins
MKSKIIVLSVMALAMCLATSRTARADDLKIAVCNPMQVLKSMQEFKDLEAKAKADQQAISAQLKQKKDAITTMQDSLNLLLPDSPQFAQQNEELLKASIDYKNTGELAQAHFIRQQKTHVKALFDKIQETAGKVAQAKGYTMVISSHQPEIDSNNLDNIDLQNLATALVIQRVVLYSDPKLDITQDVLVALDKDYGASGGGSAAPSTPPPSEAPAGH